MKKKLKCPKCGSGLKVISYGVPLDCKNDDYYYVGEMLLGSKLAYYCEQCDRPFKKEEVKEGKQYEKKD